MISIWIQASFTQVEWLIGLSLYLNNIVHTFEVLIYDFVHASWTETGLAYTTWKTLLILPSWFSKSPLMLLLVIRLWELEVRPTDETDKTERTRILYVYQTPVLQLFYNHQLPMVRSPHTDFITRFILLIFSYVRNELFLIAPIEA